ncbi:uncharacterized protein LOC129908764 [Episyrphus balteatus]|uniref:uncharacterized protein LOC129908764 n=1 Tax=Episyrphus balteatus TaxID=286459 RepID=UPI00248586FF|nr:uncharacterized protein LOC129908764 [Episyrphus balteatus]XP_055841488.1 uncharacterized protein LOC129908764 [Episyrphus balteatus]XP_055841489.1 uncharacterized protein LOC129908764 [Episyrphus balteatus]XP_055841490.1 uncharacterized protein LOC129908764 [Episyrphus balteatus]XP_055841491.1 uncharacterized protein LOC129908764 [Episyrphus balteatus]
MFRDRTEQLNHLVELYRSTVKDGFSADDEKVLQTKNDILRTEIESFSTIMINFMIEDQDLDIEFANKLYEFDSQLFITIFNAAIKKYYWTIGFNEIFRMVGGLKYFSQALEGYKTIYDQIKDNLSNYHEHSYKLREKLQQITIMKDFPKLSDEEKLHVKDMTEALEPYSMLPKPVKSKRAPNWAEHYMLLAQLENSFDEEQQKFFSLFRTET